MILTTLTNDTHLTAEDYTKTVTLIKEYSNYKLNEIAKLIKTIEDSDKQYSINNNVNNHKLMVLATNIKSLSKTSSNNDEKTEKLLVALNALCSTLENEVKAVANLSDNNLIKALYPIMASYRKIADVDNIIKNDFDISNFTSDFNEIAKELESNLVSSSSKFEFKPLFFVLVIKIVLGILFAISLLLFAIDYVASFLSFLSPNNNPDESNRVVYTMTYMFIERISFWSLIAITIFDIIRLLIMKHMANKGNISAKFSYATYMSCSPFFIYSFVTLINHKIFASYIHQVLECVEYGYIPAIYKVARWFETGQFRLFNRDISKSIEYYKLCSGYKDSEKRLNYLLNIERK